MTLDRRAFLGATLGVAAVRSSPAGAGVPPHVWTQTGTVARSGGVMHYARLGDPANPPVVLLPKLGGWIADWRHVAPHLARHFHVIAIDPSGHGGSRFAGPAPYVQTLAESAAAVMAVLFQLGIGRFSIVGNSLGGCIAIAIAAFWPEAVQRLALVSTALYGRLSLADLEEADRQVRAGSFDANWNPLPRALDATARNFGMTPQINDELNQSRAVAGQWVRPSERGVLTGRIEEQLPRVKAPTLLVYGTAGTYLKYQTIARERLSDPRIVTIDAKGAFVHQEAPDDTAKALLAFLLEKDKS